MIQQITEWSHDTWKRSIPTASGKSLCYYLAALDGTKRGIHAKSRLKRDNKSKPFSSSEIIDSGPSQCKP